MSNSPLSRIFSPTVLLYAFVVISQIADGIYVVTEGGAPAFITFLSALGLVWLVGWWLRRDNRLQNLTSVYDLGMFLYILWPFIMPYYLVKTRGARGLLVVLGFLVADVGGYLVGATIAALLTPGIS